ncbi:hypothetical protein AURDEDRAFT_171731 [Auricularia subglabra TFB-10046 SS5]|nr:hypothetical protein AURDEDRAFT_171731 [Auricularia subglabra TFB-10046 SS5]
MFEDMDPTLAQSPALCGPLTAHWLEKGDWYNERFAERLEAINAQAGDELIVPSSNPTPTPSDRPQLPPPAAEGASSSPPRSAVLIPECDSPSPPRSAVAIPTSRSPSPPRYGYQSIAFPAPLCNLDVPQPHAVPSSLSSVRQPQPFAVPSSFCGADQSFAVEAPLRDGYQSHTDETRLCDRCDFE